MIIGDGGVKATYLLIYVKLFFCSAAVLNCPACFTVVCLDCQRHDVYKTQYRSLYFPAKHCRGSGSARIRIAFGRMNPVVGPGGQK
jgi:hypothetical protein